MGAASELEGFERRESGSIRHEVCLVPIFHAAPIDVRNHGISKERLLWLAEER